MRPVIRFTYHQVIRVSFMNRYFILGFNYTIKLRIKAIGKNAKVFQP